jgi:hypothetical protein
MFTPTGFRITLITSIFSHLFAPPHIPGQAARLYPGVYSINSSNYIQIVRKGQRFCMADVSRNEKSFASLRPDRKHPSLYQVNGLSGKAVYQQDGNTIFWGPVNQMARGSRDRQLEQANLPISSDLQRCLSSNKPFFSKGKG